MPKDIYIPPKPLNLSSIYQKVFGTVAEPFPFPRTISQTINNQEGYDEVRLSPGENAQPLKGEFNFKNMLRGEYFLPASIGLNGDTFQQLPNEPIISIKGGKTIKSTMIRRGKGSGAVTEERSLKPYQITIKGICINEETGDYPEDQVTMLRELFETSGVRYIKNYLAGLWGIEKVTITSWDFSRRGSDIIHVQPYVVEMIQDLDFDDFKRIIEEDE